MTAPLDSLRAIADDMHTTVKAMRTLLERLEAVAAAGEELEPNRDYLPQTGDCTGCGMSARLCSRLVAGTDGLVTRAHLCCVACYHVPVAAEVLWRPETPDIRPAVTL